MAKPTATSVLDPTNSLAKGMILACPFYEGSGTTSMDFADPSRSLTNVTWTTVGGLPYGKQAASNSSYKTIRYPLDSGGTFSAVSRINITLTNGSNNSPFDFSPTDFSYAAGNIYQPSSTTAHWTCNFGYHGIGGAALVGSSVVTAGIYDLAMVWDGSSTLTLYVNGSSDGTATGTYDSARSGYMMARCIASIGVGASCEFFYIYDRVLSGAEVSSLASNPYSMFLTPSSGGTKGFAF